MTDCYPPTQPKWRAAGKPWVIATPRLAMFIQIISLLCLALFSSASVSAAISRDVTASKDGASASTTITSLVFTTAKSNEQLLAFIAVDYLGGTNTTVKSVSGGGLTWTLVERANAQSGSAEIWGAFSPAVLSGVSVTAIVSQSVVTSMTVMSFTGTNPLGSIGAVVSKSVASGAPSASLVTTGLNSLVLGVGNDFDNAIARTIGAGQILIHQYLTPTEDTYWVQMQAAPVAASGAAITINDTAPTEDRFNLSAVELLAAHSGAGSYSVSGTISPVSIGSGAKVAISGASSANMVADAGGSYTFAGLANGSYTVTPSKVGYTFRPSQQYVTVNGANQASVNFTAQATASWTISGIVSPIVGGAGASITLSGAASATTVADANGKYAFAGLAEGTYSVTPGKSGYSFAPASQSITLSGANQTAVNFAAQSFASWSISGTISPASGAGATVTLAGGSSAVKTADASGNYTLVRLANGTYIVTPSKSGLTFSPQIQSVTLSGANQTANFAAQAVISSSIARDVTISQDGALASTSIATPAFTTSAGNELLLAFITTDFLGGTNTTVNSASGAGLTWTLTKRVNAQSGSSEIGGAFSAVPLTGVSISATLSQSVISSITVISFTGTNPAIAIGAVGESSAATGAPNAAFVTTSANSLILGVGNDFDNATARTSGAGQVLIHQYLTSTGDTYWVQLLAGPTGAAGNIAIINDTMPTKDRYNLATVEVLAGAGSTIAGPPAVAVASPAQGSTSAGLMTVSAQATDPVAVAGVQFLLDGSPLGVEVASAPYSFVWDSSCVALGTHTLAARARNGAGLATISATITRNVASSTNTAAVGQWSSVVTLPTVAVNLVLLQNDQVLFYQDGATATVWNYVQDTFTSTPQSASIFCSGHALLADGRVLVVGGYGESSNTINKGVVELYRLFRSFYQKCAA